MVRWPDEAAAVAQLRCAGTPRLLLVAPDAPAPTGTECDEDWVRMPASDEDMRARSRALAARAARHSRVPEFKGDGRMFFRGRWVALSHGEEALARAMSDRFGEVVSHDAIAATTGDATLSPAAVRLQIMRLRKRVRAVGLAVRTVRGRGYVLEPQR
jgi:two-component system OmpR family response regulator